MATIPNPWISPDLIDEPRPFVLDERAFWKQMTGTDDDPPPLFIGEPSREYLEAIVSELAPFMAAQARR